MLRRRTFNRRRLAGFTMVEVIVAAVIFALATTGLFATVSAIRRPAAESSEETKANFLAKQILEELRNEVDANDWLDAGGPLYPGGDCSDTNYNGSLNHSLTELGYPSDYIEVTEVAGAPIRFTPVFTVSCDRQGNTPARRVDITISW